MAKMKHEMETQIELSLNEHRLQPKAGQSDNSAPTEYHTTKAMANAERALDEVYYFREQMKSMQEERKRDVEETADFINQLINNSKSE